MAKERYRFNPCPKCKKGELIELNTDDPIEFNKIKRIASCDKCSFVFNIDTQEVIYE